MPSPGSRDGAGPAGAEEPRGLAGALARAWRWCERHPWLALALLVGLHTLPVLGARDLWYGDEVRHGDALRGVVERGKVWVLELNGKPYPDKPPLWFMAVGAISVITGSTAPWVFSLANAIAAFLLAGATHGMARHVGRLSSGAALVPAMAVGVTPLVLVLSRTTRMDLLFAAFITWSLTSLYRGLFAGAGARHTLAGFLGAGLACWTKGVVGLALPVATAFAALAWRGRLRRLASRDVVLGVLAAAALVGAWAGSVALTQGSAYLDEVLREQVAGRVLDAAHHREPIWFYLALLPALLVPWSLLAFALPWRPRGWGARLRAAFAGRRDGDDGRLWLWSTVVSGLVMLSLSSMKLFIYLAPLLPALLILATGPLAAARAEQRVRFAWLAGGLWLACGLLAPWAGLDPRSPLGPVAFLPTAAALLVGGVLVLAARRAGPGALALATSLGLALLALAASATLMPGVDALGSPRALALRIAALEDAGAAPTTFGVYSGTFAYHAGRPVAASRGLDEVEKHVAAQPRALVIVPKRRAWRVQERVPGLVVMEEHAALEGAMQILARPATVDELRR